MEDPQPENSSLLEGHEGDSSHNSRRRNGNQRRIRKWGPRGIARRIRGQGLPSDNVPEGQESLLTANGGFHDAPPDSSSLLTKPINELSSDSDNGDDYYDKVEEWNHCEEVDEKDSEEEESSDDEGSDDDDDGDESESMNPEDLQESASELGNYEDGHYKDKDYDDGYRDRDYRQDGGSSRTGLSAGRPNRLLRGLGRIRPRLGPRSFSDGGQRGHDDREPKFDPYWNPNSSVSGRIEGFGSTAPDYTNPRTLREILKDFRERRIAARGGAGMQQMQVGGEDGSGRRSWRDRLEHVVDAMVDAAVPTPELEGYMTSSGRTVTTPGAKQNEGAKDPSKMSFLRREFGDDNAYIVYLEGEMVASELEVASYRARIKALEAEVRKLKGGDDDNESSSADDSSDESVKDSKESEIEWETKVPEEGILIDINGNGNDKGTNAETVSQRNADTAMSGISDDSSQESNEKKKQLASSSGESRSSLDDTTKAMNDIGKAGELIDLTAESSKEGTLIDLTETEAKITVDSELIDLNAVANEETALLESLEQVVAKESTDEVVVMAENQNTNGCKEREEDAVVDLKEDKEGDGKP